MNIRASLARLAVAMVLIASCACSQKVSNGAPSAPGGPLQDAFTAAFGKPAPYATLNDDGDHVVYTPQKLIELSPAMVALVSKEEIPGGCKACAGSLTIAYLKRGASGFTRWRTWPEVGGKGRYGAALPWTVRTDLDDGPTLVTRDDHKEGACESVKEELITLRPAGPVKAATLVTATNYDPQPGVKNPPRITGKIIPVVKGKRFAVVFSGTDPFREVYNREDEVFTNYGAAATGC